MGWLLRNGAVLLAAGLFLFGLALGHRLAAEHYQGRLARMMQAQWENQARHQKAADRQTRAAEHREAAQLARISKQYQQKLQDANAKTHRLLVELRDARRLYVPIQSSAFRSNGVSKAAPAARVRDGQTRAELSTEASRFFVGEAARADQITRQLAACQAVVRADRGQP